MPIIKRSTPQPAIAAPDAALLWEASLSVVRVFACLPFDVMRATYATAVENHLAQRSILSSRDVESLVHNLESLVLGPVARKR
jgi:hypothetical protein